MEEKQVVDIAAVLSNDDYKRGVKDGLRCNCKLRGVLAKSAARVSNVCDFVTGSGNLHVCLLFLLFFSGINDS